MKHRQMPRNITEVKCKNKFNRVSIKYRVRIRRKNFSCDSWFFDLKTAMVFRDWVNS